jgi:excisionase family DNA binding protein
MKPQRTVADVLDSLDRATVLGLINYAEHRVGLYKIILALAHARLVRLTSAPSATMDQDQLLTVPEVARVLKVSHPRAYELCRLGMLPSVKLGERQVRVRRHDLNEYVQSSQSRRYPQADAQNTRKNAPPGPHSQHIRTGGIVGSHGFVMTLAQCIE